MRNILLQGAKQEHGMGTSRQLPVELHCPTMDMAPGAGSLERFPSIVPVPCFPDIVLLPVLGPRRDHSTSMCPRDGMHCPDAFGHQFEELQGVR